MRNLDLATLRSLVAIADTGGVTRAANRLHLTQSAVSMQVKRLEELLSVRVLEREGRGVRLTVAGEQLVEAGRRMLGVNDDVVERLVTPRYEGALAVGVPSDIVYPHLPHVLRRFGRDYPRVAVTLTIDLTVALKAGLREGRFDVVLGTESKPGRRGTLLAERPLVWSGAPEGRAWRQRPLPVVFARRGIFRKATLAALDAAGIEYVERVDDTNVEALLVTIAADLGVSADLSAASLQGIAPVEHGGTLPELPRYGIVLYVSHGANEELARILGDMLAERYSLPLVSRES